MPENDPFFKCATQELHIRLPKNNGMVGKRMFHSTLLNKVQNLPNESKILCFAQSVLQTHTS